MSAKDIFHESVKNALQKEEWLITDDPLKFKFGEVNFRIDLGAEKVIAAEKAGEKIAIEIKSFLNPSAITDFYNALGQLVTKRQGHLKRLKTTNLKSGIYILKIFSGERFENKKIIIN